MANDGGKDTMFGRGRGGELQRWIGDFVLALVLFWIVALGASGSDNRAHAVTLPSIGQEMRLSTAGPLDPASTYPAVQSAQASRTLQHAQTSREQALALLSVAFAALAALNLGFWRHLRRVYASPRRSVWRRG
jgi:hypothetical protein